MIQQLGCLTLAPLAVFATVAQEAYGQAAENHESIIRITSVKPPRKAASSFIVRYGVTRDDIVHIRQITSVHQVVPLRTFVGETRHGDRKIKTRVTGTTTQLAALRGLQVMKGRFLTAADVARFNNIAVIDSTAARKLFPFGEAIGKNIRVGTHYFLIVGETKTPAESSDPPAVYVPISTMRFSIRSAIIGAGSKGCCK